tara:strand:+ start:6418 stop:6654 length:237 start_codon:yes stop_codon:yes gene_type:complete
LLKLKNKEYKFKDIDLDTRFDILTKATQDGDKILPSTLLWIMRQAVDITDDEMQYLDAGDVATLGNQVVISLLQGKKK